MRERRASGVKIISNLAGRSIELIIKLTGAEESDRRKVQSRQKLEEPTRKRDQTIHLRLENPGIFQ